jgi:hypothetical protein
VVPIDRREFRFETREHRHGGDDVPRESDCEVVGLQTSLMLPKFCYAVNDLHAVLQCYIPGLRQKWSDADWPAPLKPMLLWRWQQHGGCLKMLARPPAIICEQAHSREHSSSPSDWPNLAVWDNDPAYSISSAGATRRRAESAAGGQIGNTGTFRGKPRRDGRASGLQYLCFAI